MDIFTRTGFDFKKVADILILLLTSYFKYIYNWYILIILHWEVLV